MELTRPFFVFISMNKMGLVPNAVYAMCCFDL